MTEKNHPDAELRLRRVWRQHTGARPLDATALQRALQGLEEGAREEHREAAVAALAEDARNADLARLMLALRADARGLERESMALRRRARLPRVALALAAVLAFAAVLVLPRGQVQESAVPALPAQEGASLLTTSFEAPQEAAAERDSGRLFSAGFDS
ncbi:MAG: hypothetical protein KatS3mg126_0502 [Lysobacteraceae bacterium]|nr:MAG: hypothetical protein KatS3mg126_0502 [Xanthomonadaceae bacterium]